MLLKLTDPDTAFRDNDVLYDVGAPLPAGSTENQLKFSYRVRSNMSGGQVKIEFPGDGWAITKALTADAVSTADAWSRYITTNLVEVHQKIGDAPTVLLRIGREGKLLEER